MPKADLTELAVRLEEHLGDPHDPHSPMSYRTILEYDERETYPYDFVGALRAWGVPEYALPGEQGGRSGDVEAEFNLMRLVARRDPTTATALIITNLGFMPLWVAGTDEQKRRMIHDILHGYRLSWGLSERAYGSDLLANAMTAERVDGGYLLTGEKWLIGNATWSDGMTAIARTSERGGPGGFSLFVLDKRTAPVGTVAELPRERLHGLRGMDISGLRVNGLFVPESARIGAEGQGLEIALKATQIARAQISGIAMSAVDTGLRLTLDFTEGRILFGRPVSDIPYSRRQITECFADLMVSDAVSLGAVRALQVTPEQVSIGSSVAKYFVPTLMERSMSQLSVVLGARFFLRGHPHYGMFQKLLRDLLVANFADGNTVVNLRNLGQQLRSLLATATSTPADDGIRRTAEERAAVLYGMTRSMPAYEPWKQELSSRGRDDTVLAAPDGIGRLRALAEDCKDDDERERLLRAADVAAELLDHLGSLTTRCEELRSRLGRDFGQCAELFDLAKEYCLVHAAAACVLTFVHSHAALEEPLPSGALLLLQLERLRGHLRPHETVTDQSVIDEAMRVLRHLHREDRLFSYWQFPLAPRTADQTAARH
ncbi:acyl-CoA dehydrogenase family protein [Streptomyces sp. NL15-2K]|uniref:acyl-CoA dehydrogenase family protein n=1 Tax=Streptomyces sp. NL15-2K TaxID=376149 RepID=UPI000F55B763|nr:MULTISPECIES: acyl-CoA dehydrogenase family protein [Actinomycetes]WKX14780.1 acyl-CoA dehydrogenase family protein [Kutzneria buriramensis]GCB52505.1 acyl-CoA dehydrogenase [Streptomyces sp. NL15-2K]